MSAAMKQFAAPPALSPRPKSVDCGTERAARAGYGYPLRRASLVERLVGYILQFVARGMCNKLATIGQRDYESELGSPVLADCVAKV